MDTRRLRSWMVAALLLSALLLPGRAQAHSYFDRLYAELIFRALTLPFQIALAPVTFGQSLELRLTGKNHFVNPHDLNSDLYGENLPLLSNVPGFTFDVTGGYGPVYVGWRFQYDTLHLGNGTTSVNNPDDPNFTKVRSFMFGPVLRWYLVETKSFGFDVFGGGGWSNLTIDTKKDAVESSYRITKSQGMGFAGTSVSFGSSFFSLVLEAGYEWRRFEDKLAASGPHLNLERVNLDGPYAALGLCFNTTFEKNDKSKK